MFLLVFLIGLPESIVYIMLICVHIQCMYNVYCLYGRVTWCNIK